MEKIPSSKVREKRIRYAENPFLGDVVATLSDKRVAVAMKANLAEIDNETGEIRRIPGQITKYISADRESFVKFYTAQLQAFFELSGAGRKVVMYLIHLHQKAPNSHRIVLHHAFALEEGFDIGQAHWYAGLSELLDKKFIASAQAVSIFYLNPAIFFNGDRTRFVTEIRKRKTDADNRAELEARGQERLLP